ncbi:hypothetical protein BAU17_03170 [Enterococcus sp. CU12B]|uniref:Uncharacterized protein n=1 Tax=Candidatus Enterococcus willemsii TaxID=1857215 RepID=A0ABQ6Z3U4_9ENTE|nr:hypothetical protein BAU17_03170 [Enterococcus sp. CU12B]
MKYFKSEKTYWIHSGICTLTMFLILLFSSLFNWRLSMTMVIIIIAMVFLYAKPIYRQITMKQKN